MIDVVAGALNVVCTGITSERNIDASEIRAIRFVLKPVSGIVIFSPLSGLGVTSVEAVGYESCRMRKELPALPK